MQEYVYYSKEGLDFPLHESILVTTDLEVSKDSSFLISNSNEIKSEVTVREIDFYIKNSKDGIFEQIQNIHKLYEVAALKYDNAQDISYFEEIDKKVLLVASIDDAREVMKNVEKDEFDMYHIDESILKSISGQIGDLRVIVDDKGKDVTLNVNQIIWFGAKEEGLKQSGTFDPKKSSVDDVLKTVRSNIQNYEYRKFTTYDKNICQYHERREEVCGKCEAVCPTVAITKDDNNKHLNFSQIDCHGCGGCVSICPSGAIDYAPTNRASLYQVSLLYKNTHPLIIPNKMQIENLDIELKERVLPFTIDGEKFLHESSFLTLAQLSSSQLIFYTDFLSKGSGDAIRILNEIYQKRYGVDAVIVAMNENELKEALEIVDFVEDSYFNFNQEDMKKREIFSRRLEFLVGDKDLGEVKTGEHLHYAKVAVNEDKCTLCLSCVGACNVDALTADAKTNELKLNASICTACGYCELSCPEKDCLSMEMDVIKLNSAWFKEEVLAKDKLFACIECGEEFATTKAIERVASLMSPIFSNDPIKVRTLYCCENCKPKVMMKSHFEKNLQGVNV